jgi:hypothetical protein
MHALTVGIRKRDTLALVGMFLVSASFLLAGLTPSAVSCRSDELLAQLVADPMTATQSTWHSGATRKSLLEILHKDSSFVGSLTEVDAQGLASHKVSTKFHEASDGNIVGEYKVSGTDGEYSGTLVQRGPIHDHAMTLDWKDKYGVGTLDIIFDDDACEFAGSWQTADGTESYPWQGRSARK